MEAETDFQEPTQALNVLKAVQDFTVVEIQLLQLPKAFKTFQVLQPRTPGKEEALELGGLLERIDILQARTPGKGKSLELGQAFQSMKVWQRSIDDLQCLKIRAGFEAAEVLERGKL